MPTSSISPYASLVSHLEPPPGFLNVTDANQNGFYLFGYNDFQVMDVRVAGIFQRSMAGRYEDFVLGVLSVMLIAVLSEIIQTILMRTRSAQVSRAGLHTAFVLDELTHFRNVCDLVRGGHRRNPRTRRVATDSFIIVALGLGLLAAEVFAVFLTQPVRVYTAQYEYNLRGYQPAGTSIEMARRIDRATTNKACVTPSMKQMNQSREFSINACIMRQYKRSMDSINDESEFIEVGSWFHRAGSNHRITFGNRTHSGEHSIETRATIMQGLEGVTKGLLFAVNDTDEMAYANYLQEYLIYSAIAWNCEQGFEERTCATMEILLKTEKQEIVNKTIVLWQQGDLDVTEEVLGLVTRFRIPIRRPFIAVREALSVLATSAVIEEVRGQGMYVSMEDGVNESGIENLVSEEGRVAGVLLLGCIFIGLLMVLIILRLVLQPISLARIARNTIQEEEETWIPEQFVGAGPAGFGVELATIEPHRTIVQSPKPVHQNPFEEDEYVSSATLQLN